MARGDQEMMRRGALMRQAISDDEARVQALIDTLIEQLHVKILTGATKSARIGIDMVTHDGAIVGFDWKIEGKVRGPKR